HPQVPSGLARFEEHRVMLSVGIQEPYRAISIPKLEGVDLVLPLEMRHAELEDRRPSIGPFHRRHPRATALSVVKRRAHSERPSTLKHFYDPGNLLQPRHPLRVACAGRHELTRDRYRVFFKSVSPRGRGIHINRD